jgi:hypothetical protein
MSFGVDYFDFSYIKITYFIKDSLLCHYEIKYIKENNFEIVTTNQPTLWT